MALSLDWPRAYGEPPLRGVLRQACSDFFVEEQLGFEPDGSGEHCWLWIEKENLNTADAAQRLARFAGLRERDISYSGLKDKRAVTRQWFSLHLLNRDIDWQQWSDPALRILRAIRHSKKLRRGTHRSNYFRITLRDVQGDADALQKRIALIRTCGVPNYFGEQRFGRDARTLELAMRAAEQRSRLHRQQASLYFSALRSYLFNAVLAHRVSENNWSTPLAGELFMLNRSSSVFRQSIDAALLARYESGDIHLSGPLPGCAGNADPSDDVLRLERSVLSEYKALIDFLEASRVDSARRSLRLLPDDLRVEEIASAAWQFSFTLGRGCFATALMRELADYYSLSTE
ncbi:MAG TPA: tRNA pseudouridine(13) synthase TruD [Spongiibacteraceae bacterium]|nr:tRNA pseudouridine(13) synthase TruD [Spongiibacteraceae bacterium]